MRSSKILLGTFGLLTIFGLASWSESQEVKPVPLPDEQKKEGIEILTRGPLHEAFAQPFGVTPEPGPMVPKAPPPPLPEEPPAERPDIENAQWIPGYWAWDAERKDHIWVSGVFRVPPQNRKYVPGYWQQTDDGWRWIQGFWANPNQPEIPYTPEPPAPLDEGPQTPAPDDQSTYVPGSWVFRDGRFIWRPGYWSPFQEGRIWVPAHYVWTPNGYIFVDGYWEQPFDLRGLAYAPAYFPMPLWQDAGWRYQPSFIISFGAFFDSCFIGPRGGFYFGNFYDPFYARLGYRPWYNGRGRYDPTFAYYGHQNYRNNPNWIANQQKIYDGRVAGTVARPPIGLAQQGTVVNGKKGTPVVAPVNQVANLPVKVVKSTPTQIKAQQSVVQQTRDIATNRQRIEAANSASTRPTSQVRTLPINVFTDPTPSLPSAPKTGTQAPKTPGNPPAPKPVNPGVLSKGAAAPTPGPTLGKSPQEPKSNPGPSIINTPLPSNTGSKTIAPSIINTPPSPSPGSKVNTPSIINTLPPSNPGPKIINSTPAPITNTLPSQPKVTNSLPKSVLPPAGVTNAVPKVINTPPPPTNPTPRIINSPPRVNPAPAPAPRVAPSPAPAPRVTPAPAPRITTPPRSTPAPRVSSPPVRRK